MYWTDLEDDHKQSIRSARLSSDDRDERDVVTMDVDHPDGVAVDWVARLVPHLARVSLAVVLDQEHFLDGQRHGQDRGGEAGRQQPEGRHQRGYGRAEEPRPGPQQGSGDWVLDSTTLVEGSSNFPGFDVLVCLGL